MMFVGNQKISKRQLQVLLCLQCFGTAVLFLPAEVAAESGRNGWLTVAVGGGVFALLALLLTAQSKLPALQDTRFGKVLWLGLLATLVFGAVCELRIVCEVVCRSMLPDTPVWVLSLVLVLLCGALATKGVEVYGRFGELLFLVAVLPFLVLLIAVAVSAEYARLLPVDLPPLEGIGWGIWEMSIVFQGLPLLYVLLPFVRTTQSGRAVLGSTLAVGVVLAIVVLLSLAVYGAVPLSEKLLPTLQMLERVSASGIFLTRQDVVFLWFWICSAVVFIAGVLLMGKTERFCQNAKYQRVLFWGLVVLLWGLSFLPENLTTVYRLRLRVLPWLQLLYLVVVPLGRLLWYQTKKEKAGGQYA